MNYYKQNSTFNFGQLTPFVQLVFFKLRNNYSGKFSSWIRRIYYGFLGMSIGKKTKLPPIKVTWPHKSSNWIKLLF